MKYIFLLSIISMNFFIVISTFLNEVLKINIYPYYFITMVVIAAFTILYAFVKIGMDKAIPVKLFYVLLLFLVVTVSYAISPYHNVKLATNNYLFFLLWSIPAAVCGVFAAKFTKKEIENFFKWIFCIFSISMVFIILVPFLLGKLPSYINFGLMNYQNLSYITAFVIGLGFYFILQKSTKAKLFYIIMIILLIPVILISSGRGGAVLLILYILLTSVKIMTDKQISTLKKIILGGMILLFIVMFLSLVFVIDKDSRIFSYISDDGISLDQTSGRNFIYENDITIIKEHVWRGHGLFNYYHLINNIPHNIILEFLLIGGVFGCMIFLFLAGRLIVKYASFFNKNSPDGIVGYIALYPLTMLMFSSNFLITSEFWFVVFYLFAKIKEKTYDEA